MKTIPKQTARRTSLNFILILAMILLMSTGRTDAQITQPNAWTKAYDQVSGTATGTSFAIAPGSNRILVVAISNSLASSGNSADPSTITYGGVTLTRATSNSGTSTRMHTYLYYLKDNAVMDNTSRPLNVTITGTVLNMTVWYAVYAGVDQAPITYTTGNALNNNSTSGPAQLSASMSVNAGQQAVYISSIYNDNSTTIPGYTINANWTSGGSATGSSGGGNNVAWKNEVANRTIPGSNVTDNAATSAITPATRIRYAMSAISLPKAPSAPVITGFSPTSACIGSVPSVVITGTDFTGATAVTFFNGQTATFVVNNSTQITATLPAGAITGTLSVTTPIGTGTSSSPFTVNSLPTVDPIAGGASSVCVNSVTPAFTDATTGGSWSITPVTGTASITSGGVVTGLTAGTVTVVYTFNNGTCSNTASASLTVNPLPLVAPIADGAPGVCVGTSTPAFTNATAGGLWSISDGTGTASIDGGGIVTGLTPGTVTVVYTVNDGTCSNSATAGLIVYSTIVVNSSNVYSNSPTSTPICEGSTLELYAPPGGTSYAWFGPDGWSSDQQNPTRDTPLAAAGQYNVFIYSDCYPAGYAWSTFVGLRARPAVPGLSGPSPVCINSTDNVYTTEASMSNYAWTVSPGGSITSGGGLAENTVTVTWNTAGPQFVKVNYTNSLGCYPVSDTQFPVTVNPFPVIPGSITGPATVCPNSVGIQYSIASVSGATGYTWTLPADWSLSLGAGTTSITVVPGNIAGNVSVTADNLCGSSSPRTLAVATETANDIGFNNNVSVNTLGICAGTTGTSINGGNPSGNQTYLWQVATVDPSGPYSNASGTGNNQTYTVSFNYYNVPGVYYFRRVLSGTSGCNGNSDVVTLTVNPRPTPVISGNNTICQGSSDTYLTQAGMTNYVWTISTGGSITGGGGLTDDFVTVTWNTPGTNRFVRVNYNDANGCNAPANAQFNVTVNAAPTPTIGSDSPVCYGYNLNLSSGGGVSYVWSGPNSFYSVDQNPSIAGVTPAASGTYSVTVKDVNNCTATATTAVSIVPIIDILASSDSPQCVGSSLNLSSTDGGTSYSWVGPNGYTSSQQNPVISPVSIANSGLYIVTVATPTCGSITTATDVTINPPPVPNISGPSSTCLSITGDEYVTDPGMTNYIWTVSPGGTIIAGGTSSSNTATVKWNTHGAQSVSVNYTNSIGCSGSSIYNVTVILPFISSGPTSACIGSTDNVYSSEAGMTNYVWTVSAGGEITAGGGSTDNSVTVTWKTIGAQSVGVNYTTAEGCTAITPTIRNVTVNPLPVPTIAGPVNACQEGSAGFVYTTQPGMSNYIWTVSPGGIINSGNGTNSVNITWKSTGSQSLSVTYTNGNGCSPTVPTVYNVTVNPRPVPTITGSDFVCNGLTGVYTTEPGMTGYTWGISGGGSITAGAGTNSVTITFTSTGDKYISVNYTSQSGCRPATASVMMVTVNALPSPTINGPSPVCLNSSGNVYTTQAGNSGYVWSISGGTITAGAGTNSVTVTWTSAVNTSLGVNYVNSTGCTAASPANLNVTVIPLPSTTGSTITYGQPGSSGALTFTSNCDPINSLKGPFNPSTGSNITGVGTVGWTGAGNITNVTDNNYATLTLGQNGETSNYLRGTGYGFAIPTGATINGISVVINRETSGSTSPLLRDNRVSLVKAGVIQTTNYAKTSDNWSTGGLGTATYGIGQTDLWGTTWTVSDINNSGFGVVLSAINTNTSRSRDATIDYMQITVYYTLPGNIQWYAASSGGPVIFTGNPFNSLIEGASGLTNMTTPGSYTFYTVCSNAPDCRAPATLLIEKAEQTISWNAPANITFGTPLSVAQLNATVAGLTGGAAPGTLTYDPIEGTTLSAGTHILHVKAAETPYYKEATFDVSIQVNKADAVISVTPYSLPYDGNPHTAAGTAKGVNNDDLLGLDLSGTTHTNAGDYPSDAWVFTDVTGNYNDATGSVHDAIAKVDATIVVTPYDVTYDGDPHTATGSATGAKGESLSGLDLSGTSHTNAGSYPSDPWAFTDVTGNYNNASSTVSDNISKANATIVVTPYDVTYDGDTHTATGTATGAKGESLSGLALSGTTHTSAGVYTTDPWTFTDVTGNYNDANGTVNDKIGKADATIDVNPYNVAYDGNAHTATGTSTGAKGESLAGLDLSGTTHTIAGDYTDGWTFTDATGNYKDATGSVNDKIGKATATIVVTPYDVTYDGNAHSATGTVKGVNNEDLVGLDLSGTTHTNAGNYTDTWSFTDVTGNYSNATSTVNDKIGKADAIIVVTPYSVTYDSNPHTALGTATGVKGESLAGLDLSGTTHTNAGNYTADAWTFTDVTGNYNNATATVHDVIAKATATIVVTPYDVTYDGNAHTATGTAKGVMNEDLLGLDLSGTNHTNAGNYLADPWTFTDATGNYLDASGTVNDKIGKAGAIIVVSPYDVTYDGDAHTATGTATGVKGESLAGLDLSGTTHTSAGVYTTDPWTFTDITGNYVNASNTVSDKIGKAAANIIVTPYSVAYDGNSHTATGTVTGAKGESLAGLDLSGTSHTDAGSYPTDAWTFTDATGNYNNTSGTVSDNIGKASAVIVVTPYDVTYDGNAHTATGTAKGVNNEDLPGLILSGTIHTHAGNYTDTWTYTDITGNYSNATGTVNDKIGKADAAIVVTPYNLTYDSNPHTAIGSATGVKGESLAGLDLSGTTHTNAGDYPSDTWIFTDVTGNYNNATATVHDAIAKATAEIVVTPYDVTYDGDAHTAAGTAKGVMNEDLLGLNLSGTIHTNAGTYIDTWTFTDATGNYLSASGTVTDKIVKAIATIVVTPYSVSYDNNAHTASGTATGAKGESLAGLNLAGTTHTDPGLYSDTWTFADNGNYNSASGTISDFISKADAIVIVTGFTGAYDGSAHGASGTASGVGGANLNASLNLGATFTTVPGGTAHWTFTGGTYYKDQSGDVAINIGQMTINVTAGPKTKVYGDLDPELTYTFTPSLLGGDLFSGNLTRDPGVNVGNYAINKGTLSLSSNYNLSYAGANFTINTRPITVTADAVSKDFGSLDPAFTYKITSGNLIAPDAFTGALVCTHTEQPGTYPILQGTLALSTNYLLTYVGADFTIKPKTVGPAVTVSPSVVQYSDQVTFTATITMGAPLLSGRLHPLAFVTFKIGSQEMGTVLMKVNGLDLVGKLTTSLLERERGQLAPGNKTVYAVFSFPDSKIKVSPNPVTTSLTITPEDARVNMTGLFIESTSEDFHKFGNDEDNRISLRATVQDISAARYDQDYDPYAGDIRNAKVRFMKGSVAISPWLTPELVNGRDSKTGTVNFKWVYDNGSKNLPNDINIEVGGNGYYVRSNPADMSVVTLYSPTGNYVVGGGYIMNPYNTGGVYAGTPGLNTNFGFVVKFIDKGKNPNGNIHFIIRKADDTGIHTYLVESTSITSLGVTNHTHHSTISSVLAKANMTDITNTGAPVIVGSNLKLQINMTDNSESSSNDQIGITLWNGGALYFSSSWTGNSTAQRTLGAGRIIIHSGYSFGDSFNAMDNSNDEFMRTPELGVKAYPNPFTDHVYFDLQLNTDSKVRLEIFDVTGAKISTVFDDVVIAYNRYQLEYAPERLSSNMLMYKLIVDDKIVFTGKLIHK